MFTTIAHREGLLQRVLRANAVLISFVLVHYILTVLISRYTGVSFGPGVLSSLGTLLGTLIPAYLMVLLLWRFGWMVLRVRPERPIAWMVADLKRIVLDPDRLVGGMLALTSIALFQKSFSYLKDMVPVLNPFAWDTTFIAWDRALHFGTDPYVLLMPLVRSATAMGVLNTAYHFWFFLMLFLIFVASFDRTNPRTRMTFLMAHVLTWSIGGNLIATLLSSVGPVYVERMGLGDTYVPLMTSLNALSAQVWLPALEVQEALWQGYAFGGPMTGISAMPSMHVGSTMIFVCYAFTWRRWAGWLTLGFWGLIMIGSVTLGWHYAVDGYLGAAIALACWWGAGRIVARLG
jgi:hypothetical protein